jgi:dTDP-4-amino-4,6-dideoxygalactose transaminase
VADVGRSIARGDTVPTDIRLDDLGPDLDDLAARITPRTRGSRRAPARLPVDLGPLLKLADGRRLVIVEDCSHAHGATLGGRRVGSFGVAGAFSLGVVKNLAAYGDAGLVSTDDAGVAERVKLLGTHGQAQKNQHELYGTNSRLDELHAAMLRVKLRGLEARNRRRREIAAYYTERLRAFVTPPYEDAARVSVYHQYVVRTPVRDALRAHLAAHDVETGVHYPVPIHRQPAWLDRFGNGPALPHAERAAREILSLPAFPDLTDAEVERVATAAAGFFRR